MRVTSKGQVTIPQAIRERLGITAHSEVDFIEEGDKVVLVKRGDRRPTRFHHLVGSASVRMTTDEIMQLTRGEE
ncbi:AbrB/MazE/SpoVT family DNA-binding domain-containing protein [Endothiovibrio diazotrophicus]